MLSWFTVRQLSAKDEYKRKEAAEKLGETGDAAAVEALTKALKDDSYLVRQAVAEALGKIKDVRAVE